MWETLRDCWPNAGASSFVNAGGLRWHVQRMGSGPVVLLLHGSGAASHSWGDVAPILAEHFTVIVPDLPGHGFTERLPDDRLSITGIADALGALLEALDARPVGI